MKKVLSFILIISILMSAVSACFVAFAAPDGTVYDIICDDYSMAQDDSYTPITQAAAGQVIKPQVNYMAVEQLAADQYLPGEFIISDGVNSTTVKEGESYVMPAGAVSITTVIKEKTVAAFTLNSTTPKYISSTLVSALMESEWTIYDETGSDVYLDFNADKVVDAVIKTVEPQPGTIRFTIALTPKATVPDKTYTMDLSDWGAYYPYKGVSVKVATNTVASITAPAVKTVYGLNKYLIITVKNALGKVLANKKVVVIISGKRYSLTTNAKGQAKLALKGIAPSNYKVAIASEGVSGTTKVVIAKAIPKLIAKAKTFKKSVKVKKYTVNLKNNLGKPISKAKVTLKVNGKTYASKTNAKGQATFKLTKLTKKGKYKGKIIFKGNKYYKYINKNVKIVVK